MTSEMDSDQGTHGSPRKHPSERTLRRFLQGDLPASGNRRVVHHLLTDCPTCRAVTARLWQEVPEPPAAWDRAIDRALRRVKEIPAKIGRLRVEARELEADLDRHPPARQLVLVQNSRRFHNWFLCERLLERAYDEGYKDPATARHLAELGVAVAGALDETVYGGPLVRDLQARAWALLGNARRIGSDLGGAAEALARARELLAQGTGDPLEAAMLDQLEAALCFEYRRFAEQSRLLDRAIAGFRRLGSDREVGILLFEKARGLGESGDLQGAIRLVEEALTVLDPKRQQRMVLAAKHNLTVFKHESGQIEEALALLREIVPLHEERGEAMNLLRLSWLEGRMARSQGQPELAEQILSGVREGFLERGILNDVALVSLELATLYLEQGRTAELKELAAELASAFDTLGVPRETLAAVRLFRQAVEMESLTLRSLAELAKLLEQSRPRS